jgi:hypothetical protein
VFCYSFEDKELVMCVYDVYIDMQTFNKVISDFSFNNKSSDENTDNVYLIFSRYWGGRLI